MLLHDATDIFVCLAKIARDCASDTTLKLSWIFMFVSWIYLRLYYFPDRILKVYYLEMYDNPHKTIQGTFNFLYAFLTILYVLHWFWAY